MALLGLISLGSLNRSRQEWRFSCASNSPMNSSLSLVVAVPVVLFQISETLSILTIARNVAPTILKKTVTPALAKSVATNGQIAKTRTNIAKYSIMTMTECKSSVFYVFNRRPPSYLQRHYKHLQRSEIGPQSNCCKKCNGSNRKPKASTRN